MGELILLFRRFARSQRAVTSLEYAIIASLAAVVIIASVKFYGLSLAALFTKIGTAAAEG